MGAGGLAEQIGRYLGAQALHHQQVDAAGEGKIFIADGAHKVLHHPLVGGAAVREQQPLVGQQQHLTGGGSQHGDRAGQAGASQHVPEHPARLYLGDGDAHPARCRAVGLQLAGQHDAHPAAGLPRQHKGFALAVAAHTAPQPGQQRAELRSGKPREQRGGL